MDGARPELARQFRASNICFEPKRLDLRRAAAECDLAILNGTHGSTLLMLLHGKPVLQLPLFLEQELNAKATVRCQAGEISSPRKHDGLDAKLEALLHSDAHSAGAARFAAKYAGHDPQEQAGRPSSGCSN